jgi:uncharacterized membrane protein YphA (DoxX/SURF4 family)
VKVYNFQSTHYYFFGGEASKCYTRAMYKSFSKIEIFSRISLFIIYFWFGLLKVIGLSPASPLVKDLYDKTIAPFISYNAVLNPDKFLIYFGIGECILGILFLIPQLTKLSKWLFTLHMVTTFMPLVLVPHDVWTKWFAPTLEGQYIVKNLGLIATVFHLKQPEKISS